MRTLALRAIRIAVPLVLGLAMATCNERTTTSRCVEVDPYEGVTTFPEIGYWCGMSPNEKASEGPEGVNFQKGAYLYEPGPTRPCDGCLWEGVEEEVARAWRDTWCPSQPLDVIQHVEIGCYVPYDSRPSSDDDLCTLHVLAWVGTECPQGGGHPTPPYFPEL